MAEGGGAGQARGAFAIVAIAATALALFSASVVFRAPYLGRPMGLHHEEGTARTLVHASAWWEDGATRGGYLMRTNLSSPGDRFLGGDADERGDAYYYSFPPGHPLWAFLAHRVAGVEPTVASVRYFNLGLHLASAAMVLLVVVDLLRRLPWLWRGTAAVAAFSAYVFAPVTMWYQSNSYTTASAVQPFFASAVLAAVLAFRARRFRLVAAVFGTLVFLMAYTEWLGLAFAAVAAALAVAKRRDPTMRALGVAAAAGAMLAMAVTVAQYATKLGISGVITTMAGRYADRSGLAEGVGYTLWNPASWVRLFGIYGNALGAVIAALTVMMLWDRVAARGSTGRFRPGETPVSILLVLATGPVLVHHAVLFDHTVVHDFDTLKTAVPLAIAIGYLAGRIMARASSAGTRRVRMAVAGLVLVTVVTCGASLAVFARVNAKEYPQPKALGERIASEVRPDEVVFVQAASYLPKSVLTHYTGRSYVVWQANPAKAAAILERGGGRTGVLFWVDEFLNVNAVGYVGVDGVVYPTREIAGQTLVR